MGRVPEGLGQDVQRYIREQGLTLGRKACSAIAQAHDAGVEQSHIDANIIDAAARAQAGGIRKIGAFGPTRNSVNRLREETHWTRFQRGLDRGR